MRSEIEEIRDALTSIGELDDKTLDALRQLEESIDDIESHPAGEQVRELVAETAVGVQSGEKPSAVSEKWHALGEHLEEWEDHHPRVTLVVGRMAEALSVVGL